MQEIETTKTKLESLILAKAKIKTCIEEINHFLTDLDTNNSLEEDNYGAQSIHERA